MPSVISRCAAVAVRLLRVTVQLVLPCPPHPTCCAVGVGGAVTDAVILVIVPRPLWSLFPRLNGPDDPGLAGTGFWPGAALPPLFEQVYVATPVTVRLAIAGVFPSPLKLPPVRVTDAPLKVAVGSDFTVTAASAIEEGPEVWGVHRLCPGASSARVPGWSRQCLSPRGCGGDSSGRRIHLLNSR